ncbi:MAG: hypothetical protein MR561_04890, partial [Prevotella sp.]|nr:hypothetical protein [Prevotella sp.]
IAMLYYDAATFCRRRNDAGIMTDETGRRCAQESIDIIIMKNNYNYLFIIKIILITYLLSGCLAILLFCCLHGAEKAHKHSHCANGFYRWLPANGRKSRALIPRKKTQKNGVTITGSFVSQY